jgi:D-alanyl-D-alanine carboxypeptidase/D-alanyl-D-alanine-endopeptidase (penicillin-binding protein 4)
MLNRAGIVRDGLVVADGSGLSRDNTCTARQLVELLTWASAQRWAAVFHDSLAEAGSDGSLQKRLRDAPGHVFAKTGTMRGVRALAGYVDDDRGPRYAFAILFNNYPGPSTPYKQIQDDFCRTLIDMAPVSDR